MVKKYIINQYTTVKSLKNSQYIVKGYFLNNIFLPTMYKQV
nr:MAG TPA: hypothetical protein [Caudoviricetes sp.]